MNSSDFLLHALSQFIDHIPQMVFWKDVNSVYMGCSDGFAKFIGLGSKEQIVGKTDYDLPWKKRYADKFIEMDRKVMHSRKAHLNHKRTFVLNNGREKWGSINKIPLYNEKKEVVGVVGWYIDISEVKKMEMEGEMNEKSKILYEYNRQLEQTNKELELANLDLEKFTFAASHDLKSPLRIMANFCQILIDENKEVLNEESLYYLNFMDKSAKRMYALVQDILSYAKAGSANSEPVFTNLLEIAREKYRDLEEIISGKKIDVTLEITEKPILCHPNLMGLVFYNLLDNSIKYNKSSTPKVSISSEEKEDYWLFSVTDNGIGISVEKREKIFLPFERLVSRDQYEGTGIGLSICKRIITIHEGRIWVEENPTGGTIFYFTIYKFR